MRIERGFGEYFKYSLHDARILKIEHINDNLILYFDYIFSYNEDRSENTHKAKIIFEKVGANPSDANINVKEIAEKSTDATTKLLGQAISQVKEAKSIVPTISDVWGGDVHTAIINALTESAAENVNIEQKVKATQDILKSLIN